jgi:hypothetical protein
MDWQSLIKDLTAGKVIPVLGGDLSLVKVIREKEDCLVSINEYIAGELPGKLNIPQTIGKRCGLEEFVAAYRNSDRYEELIKTVNSIYEEIDENQLYLDYLEKLGRIPDFNIFISTTPDKFLEKALCKARNIKYNQIEVLKYSLQNTSGQNSTGKKEEPAALSNRNKEESRVKVIKLMGCFDNVVSPALTDEEMLEHFFSISMKKYTHPLLKEFMQLIENKTLLFIGCDFPDWFMRFIIRIITNERYQSRTICDYIVWNGPGEREKLYQFLKQFKKNIYPPEEGQNEDLSKFFEKLHDQLRIYETVPIQYEGTVFLSYKSQDVDKARMLKRILSKNGIDVWFDERDLAIGQHKEKIENEIRRCKVFVPIISGNSLSAPPNSYLKAVEWLAGESRFNADNYYKRLTFQVVPIIIDDKKKASDERIPNFMKKFTIRNFPQDIDDIIKDIKSYLKKIDKPGEF